MAVQDWDATFEGTPDGDSALPSTIDDRIRELKETIRSLNQKEHAHEFTDSLVEQGLHLPGSAVIFEGASTPTLPADPDNTGRVWSNSSSDSLKAYVSTGWNTIRDQKLGTSDDVTFGSIEGDLASTVLMTDGPIGIEATKYTSGDIYDTIAPHITNEGDTVRISFVWQLQVWNGFDWELRTFIASYAERFTSPIDYVVFYGIEFVRVWSGTVGNPTPSAPYTFNTPTATTAGFDSGDADLGSSGGGGASFYWTGHLTVFDME
jgi:hypothetical protein